MSEVIERLAVILFAAWYFLPAITWLRFWLRQHSATAYMQAAVAEREARGVKRELRRNQPW